MIGTRSDARLPCRFIECEKWREEIKLDETVPTWEYPEKEEMFKYYPQYYHKTDKVPPSPFASVVRRCPR